MWNLSLAIAFDLILGCTNWVTLDEAAPHTPASPLRLRGMKIMNYHVFDITLA